MNYFKDVDIFSDGWVFLLGGSNEVSKYWLDGARLPRKTLDNWSRLLKNRIEVFERKGIQYLLAFAPEKLTIYSDKTPYKFPDSNIPFYQLYNNLDEGVRGYIVDLIPYLRTQSKTFKTYHKTDSHWNFYGAFSAYQVIQSRLGFPTYTDALNRPQNICWSVMDLGGKFDPPLKEQVFYYNSSKNFERVFANELVNFKEKEKRENDPGLHVGSYVVFKNKSAIVDKKLLIFGDSFSEYRDHLLTGLMAETYREVHFVWSSQIDFELVEKIKPDIVISEMAERFIPLCPKT